MWRKRGEGLSRECTAKGRKEGRGGRMAKFMAAIAYGKGVIECHQYEGGLSGKKCAQFFRDRFPVIVERGNNQRGRLFL